MPDRASNHPVGRFLAKLAAPALAPLPDGELLGHYLTGCEAAFALLVTRHGNMARAAALRVLGNPSDADDATQVAFALLAENAARLADCRSVGGWLHGTARKVALQLRRRQLRQAKRERRAARPEAVQPADAVERAELLSALDAAMAKLPSHLREAVVLCELEGVPRQTAAERLGVPVGTLSSRLASARRQLARRLGGPMAGAALAALLAPSSGASLPATAAGAVWISKVSPTAKLLLWEVKRMALIVKLKLVAATVGVAVGAVGVTAGAGGLVGGGGAPIAAAQAPEAAPKPAEKAAETPEVKAVAAETKLSPEALALQSMDLQDRLVGLWKRAKVETASGRPVSPGLTLIEELDLRASLPPRLLGRTMRVQFAVVTPTGVRLIDRDGAYAPMPESSPRPRQALLLFVTEPTAAGSQGLTPRFMARAELAGDELKLTVPLFQGSDTLFPPYPPCVESEEQAGAVRNMTADDPKVVPKPDVAETYVLTFRRQPQPKPAPAAAPAPKAAAPAAPSALDKRVAELKREQVELLKGYHAAVAGQAGPAPAPPDTEPASARNFDRERYQALLKADWLAIELELATPPEALAKRREVVGALREAEQIDADYLRRLRGFSPKKQEVLARAIDLTRRRTEAEIEYERLKAAGAVQK